ncbi:MAG: zinc dependent phospholipase C family protein [Sediminibacterium sp.]|nr:zinc dependent phospholipase C family protein [Sediminibacterium sp.]
MIKRFFLNPILFFILIIISSSWGFLAHKTISQLAVYQLPVEMQPFFFKHINYIVNNAIRADQRRGSDPTEGTKHFVDLEAFEKTPSNKMPMYYQDAIKKYGIDSLKKYGYVPYYIIEMKEKLTLAFKNVQKDDILYAAADIAHYIADAQVPLHTTINYDGQLTNQKGLHALWESAVPEYELTNFNLYSNHQAIYLKDPSIQIWQNIRTAQGLLSEVFLQEKKVSEQFTDSTKYESKYRYGRWQKEYAPAFAKEYAKQVKTSVVQQLNNSVQLIADIWFTAWVDAGKPNLTTIAGELTVEEKNDLANQISNYKKNTLIEKGMLISLKTK